MHPDPKHVQDAFWQEARYLLTFHTTPWELDEALTAWGYAMGPCEAMDLLGLEKVLARQTEDEAVLVLHRMVVEGRIGKAGSVGFYRYPGGGGAVIDPLIEDLIIEEVRFAGRVRDEWPEPALVARMNAALGKALKGCTPTEVLGLAEVVHFPAGRIAELTG